MPGMDTKILRITEIPRLDQTSLSFKTDRMVQFMVGDHGPFQLTIPGDQFTAARAEQLVEEQAAEIRKLFGQ